jgi:hypothetical protein
VRDAGSELPEQGELLCLHQTVLRVRKLSSDCVRS